MHAPFDDLDEGLAKDADSVYNVFKLLQDLDFGYWNSDFGIESYKLATWRMC